MRHSLRALMGLLFVIDSTNLALDPSNIRVGENSGVARPASWFNSATSNDVFDSVKRVPDASGDFTDGGYTGLKTVQV